MMRVYYPYPARRIQVVRVRRSGGGVFFFVGALLLSVWLVRSEPYEIKTALRATMAWVSDVGRAILGRDDRSERMVLLAPRPLDGLTPAPTSTSAPIYGHDERTYIPYGNGFDTLRDKLGQATTLRAVSFEKRALGRCVKRCEIAFRDHFGRSVTGVFFKGAHYDRLQASRGKVTITGLVQQAPDQTYVMYIQRVL